MKKFYLLTFLLLSSTAIAEASTTISKDTSLSIQNDGTVDSWAVLDGGEGAWAGDLEEELMRTRYEDTQSGYADSDNTLHKTKNALNTYNSTEVQKKYNTASRLNTEADTIYEDMAKKRLAYDAAKARTDADCAPLSITSSYCGSSTAIQAIAQVAYEDALKASTEADAKRDEAFEALNNANEETRQVMAKIDDTKATELRKQMSSFKTDQWDSLMSNDSSRQALQQQLTQLHQEYSVPEYDLSNETERQQAKAFVDTLNKSLDLRDMSSDSANIRRQYFQVNAPDGDGGPDKPIPDV